MDARPVETSRHPPPESYHGSIGGLIGVSFSVLSSRPALQCVPPVFRNPKRSDRDRIIANFNGGTLDERSGVLVGVRWRGGAPIFAASLVACLLTDEFAPLHGLLMAAGLGMMGVCHWRLHHRLRDAPDA